MSKWETVDQGENLIMRRIKVPGGWYVYMNLNGGGNAKFDFLPDPKYSWESMDDMDKLEK